MRKLLGVTALVVLGLLQVPGTFAQGAALDKRLASARNVALGFGTGFEFTKHPPSSEDRDAYFTIRQELELSGRYWIVDREGAELLIAIRVRGVSDGNSGRAVRRHGLTFRNEGFPKADMLSVHDARYRQLGVPLWRGVLVGGLSGDRPPLLASFLGDVERLAKQP